MFVELSIRELHFPETNGKFLYSRFKNIVYLSRDSYILARFVCYFARLVNTMFSHALHFVTRIARSI